MAYAGFLNNKLDASILAACMVGALLAFLYFNWYPVKVFPGDTLTYSVGALIACIAILGNIQKIAVILFIPYAIDIFLSLRKRFEVEAFAKVNNDGSLEQPYDKIYDIAHLAIVVIKRMKPKVYEKDVVIFILGIELFFVGVAFASFL